MTDRVGLRFYQGDFGWLLSLLAAGLLVYLPFLGNPFVFDDLGFFSADTLNGYSHSLHFDPRWLPNASIAWTYALFDSLNPASFRLGNALLHGINVILLFYLLRLLMGAAIEEQQRHFTTIWGAWIGALVFACHPVAVYAVGYAIQRSILMATCFALVMQLAWLKGLLTGKQRWLWAAVAAFFLAAFSKEHSVLMPGVLLAITLLLRKKNQASAGAMWLTGSAFAVIGLLLVLSSRGVLGTPYEFFSSLRLEQQGLVVSTPKLYLLTVLTQAGLFFKYLMLWVLPNPAWMSVDMREHFILSLQEWQGWAGALGFILYGVVAFRLLLRPRWRGLVGLALLYPWLQFWVEFTGIRVQEPFVLYRSYLWLPGTMLLFPLLAAKFFQTSFLGLGAEQALLTTSAVNKLPSRRALLAGVGVVLLLVPLAWNRLWVFADNYRLWNDAALLLPDEHVVGADRIFYNRAKALDSAHRWDEAIPDYQRAIALSPQLAPMRYALGMAYAKSRHYPEALVQLDVAITLQPKVAIGYYGKGLVLMQLNQRDQALQQMNKSCELGEKSACAMVAKLTPP